MDECGAEPVVKPPPPCISMQKELLPPRGGCDGDVQNPFIYPDPACYGIYGRAGDFAPGIDNARIVQLMLDPEPFDQSAEHFPESLWTMTG